MMGMNSRLARKDWGWQIWRCRDGKRTDWGKRFTNTNNQYLARKKCKWECIGVYSQFKANPVANILIYSTAHQPSTEEVTFDTLGNATQSYKSAFLFLTEDGASACRVTLLMLSRINTAKMFSLKCNFSFIWTPDDEIQFMLRWQFFSPFFNQECTSAKGLWHNTTLCHASHLQTKTRPNYRIRNTESMGGGGVGWG